MAALAHGKQGKGLDLTMTLNIAMPQPRHLMSTLGGKLLNTFSFLGRYVRINKASWFVSNFVYSSKQDITSFEFIYNSIALKRGLAIFNSIFSDILKDAIVKNIFSENLFEKQFEHVLALFKKKRIYFLSIEGMQIAQNKINKKKKKSRF